MKLLKVAVCLGALLLGFLCTVSGQTEWVWGKNRITGSSNGPSNPQIGINNNNNGPSGSSGLVPVNTVNIFPSGSSGVSGFNGGNNGGGDKNVPYISQQQQGQQLTQVLQPGSTNGVGSTGSNGLPSSSIRAVQGEPRLFTRHIRRFVENAVNNLSGGNGVGSSSTGANNAVVPGGLLGALLALGPSFIGNRFPNLPSSGGLPISSGDFNTEGNGISSGSSSSKPNRPNRPNRPTISNSGRVCACVSDDQCRLPSIVMGSCDGGTGVMCCRSSGVRVLGSDNRRERDRDRDRDSDSQASNPRVQTAEIRAGLFGEIVRGTSNVIDDALDLILAPYLTQEDQEKLASRLGTSRGASRKN